MSKYDFMSNQRHGHLSFTNEPTVLIVFMLCTFGKKKEAKMLIFNILTSITSDSVGIRTLDPRLRRALL